MKAVRDLWIAGRTRRGKTSGGSSPQSRRGGRRRRRLRLEPLEARVLLAADCLAAIAGTVFSDATDNDLSVDDSRLSGVTINLYQDGGNGTFDGGSGDDALLASQLTGVAGGYRFDDLTAGMYFVQQEAAVGLLQRAGDDLSTVVITPADAAGVSKVAVDTFETAQSVTANSTGSMIDSSFAAATEVLGGERDLFAELTSGMGELALLADAFDAEILEFMASSTGQGTRLVTWDGPDMDATTLDAVGLRMGGASGFDLTEGGTNVGLEMSLGADQDDGEATIRVFTDAGNSSAVSVSIPNTGGTAAERIVIRFEDFATTLGGGADFTNVGAVQLEIAGVAAVDGQIDLLGAVQPTIHTVNFANLEPLSVGDQVWRDTDNGGTLDAGEVGIAGVDVDLFEDTNASGSFTPGVDVLLDSTTTNGVGVYGFDGLLPGDYIVRIAASNFGSSQPLEDLISSMGNDPAPDPDNDLDDDDNGAALAGQGVVAEAVTLASGVEPAGDDNPTVDFGFAPQVDLSVTKSDSPDPVGAGNTLTYTLDVVNNGPADATGVTAIDALPSGVTFVTASATQGTFGEAGGVVTFNVGSLANGASAQLTIEVTVNGDTIGSVTNFAEVASIEFDPNTSNNSTQEATLVTPRVDLLITKSDTPDPATPGGTVTYTLEVTNGGPSDATGVTVTDMLPNGVTFDSATTTQGSFTTSQGEVVFNVGNLASNATAQMTVAVVIDPNIRGTIVNTAEVAANEEEINTDNNVDSETTTLEALVDLTITKSDQPDPVVAGTQLDYTLVVGNLGPSQATDVVVTDTLPAGVTFVDVDSDQGTGSHSGGVVTVDVGDMDPGDSVEISITVIVDSSTTGILTNLAVAESNEDEASTSNNTHQITTTVDTEIDLAVTKSESVDPVLAGEPLVYTVQVVNNGPSDATGVTLVDTLPDDVVFVSATSTQGSTPTESNGVVTANVGDLADGASATLTINVIVNLDAIGAIQNSVTVHANETDTNTGNDTDVEQTEVTPIPSSISGFVYVDSDNDGEFEPDETPVRNVVIRLTGTDFQGSAVNLVETTDENGAYAFVDLMPGTYRVAETQPRRLRDGRETRGTFNLGQVHDDIFAEMDLPGGVEAEDYNFGERGPVISKLWYLASSEVPF